MQDSRFGLTGWAADVHVRDVLAIDLPFFMKRPTRSRGTRSPRAITIRRGSCRLVIGS